MKRELPFTSPPENTKPPEMVGSSGKSKLWEDEVLNDTGEDELLAVLGYKVRSSDMKEVAQKIEQLEEFMGSAQGDGLSQLASETVHYNPSDLSTWLGSMLSEFNPTVEDPCVVLGHGQPSDEVMDPYCDYDLKAIPGKAILSPPQQQHVQTNNINNNNNIIVAYNSGCVGQSPISILSSSGSFVINSDGSNNNRNMDGSSSTTREAKRLKSSNYGSSSTTTTTAVAGGGAIQSIQLPTTAAVDAGKLSNWRTSSRAVVLPDSQENGVRLVHTLMACAEAIQQENMALAEALVKQIGFLATSQAGSMRKVATYFAEALARRVYKICSNLPPNDDNLSDMLQMHFYETCPYLKFAHFTANQAILEAFSGKNRVHVIDFSMKQGMQWPALMQALALRPEGPPIFRLTGIGPPAPDNSDRLQEVGWKLAQFADSVQIKFEYRGFVANSLTDLEAGLLDLRPESEAVAVNSVFELHRLLSRPGAAEIVMGLIKDVNPVVVTVVEQEANHNGPVFLDRFNQSLHYYSTMFDSLETCLNNEDKVMTEVYLGRQICNVVACEGVDRIERHESLSQWRTRFNSSGFTPVHLGSNAFKQASMLLDIFAGGEGYGVEEKEGCLMLGWHNRPLITTSAWQLAKKNSPTRR